MLRVGVPAGPLRQGDICAGLISVKRQKDFRELSMRSNFPRKSGPSKFVRKGAPILIVSSMPWH
jgi:hypothetical protein